MGSSHESEPSCGRGEIESVTPTQRRAGGRVGIPDGAVNAATPMVDCYSAKSGRFARNFARVALLRVAAEAGTSLVCTPVTSGRTAAEQ